MPSENLEKKPWEGTKTLLDARGFKKILIHLQYIYWMCSFLLMMNSQSKWDKIAINQFLFILDSPPPSLVGTLCSDFLFVKSWRH